MYKTYEHDSPFSHLHGIHHQVARGNDGHPVWWAWDGTAISLLGHLVRFQSDDQFAWFKACGPLCNCQVPLQFLDYELSADGRELCPKGERRALDLLGRPRLDLVSRCLGPAAGCCPSFVSPLPIALHLWLDVILGLLAFYCNIPHLGSSPERILGMGMRLPTICDDCILFCWLACCVSAGRNGQCIAIKFLFVPARLWFGQCTGHIRVLL